MEMLIDRIEKERIQYQQHIYSELEAQRVQMQNMMAANMKQAEQEREAFIKDNQASEMRFLEVQRSNEENMKLIRNMTHLIAKQHKEKEFLRENAKELPKDKMEALLKQETSDEEDENTCHEKLDEVPDMIKLRSEIVGNLSKKISETHQEQNKVEMSSIIKKGLKFIARAAIPITSLFAIVQPQRGVLAATVSAALTSAVELSDACGIM